MTQSSLTIGIDEAGRGPVIGPLVLCGVCADDSVIRKLRRLRIRDSKWYAQQPSGELLRCEMAAKIRDIANGVVLRVAEPATVDEWVLRGQLNHLERRLAQEIIGELPMSSHIVVDGERLFSPLIENYPQLQAFDRADETNPVVAAASIVAKVERDRQVALLLDSFIPEFGPIAGNGYCNKGTEVFLQAFFAKYRCLPTGIRRSWGWNVLIQLIQQSSPEVSNES